MVFDKLGPIFIKKIESISNFCRICDIFAFYFDNVGMKFFGLELDLLSNFSGISCQIPFHIKVVLLQFLSKNNLKYSLLDLRIEKVTSFLGFFNSLWIFFFFLSFILAGTIFSEQFTSFPHNVWFLYLFMVLTTKFFLFWWL